MFGTNFVSKGFPTFYGVRALRRSERTLRHAKRVPPCASTQREALKLLSYEVERAMFLHMVDVVVVLNTAARLFTLNERAASC